MILHKKIENSKIIVLFTNSFPYGKGEQFIETEINYLSNAFEKVYIIPCNEISGIKRQIPNNVEVICEFVEYCHKKNFYKNYIRFIKSFCKLEFWREIWIKKNIIWFPKSLCRLLAWISRAYDLHNWLLNFISQKRLIITQTVFYTYWFSFSTYGIIKLKNTYKNIKVVTRAHGGDLYEDRYIPHYIPLRKQTLHYIDSVFFISEHGKKYMESLYPEYTDKFVISRLGVENPCFVSSTSKDNKMRIASCSSAIPIKRVDVIIRAISSCAITHKNINFEWHYIGDGPLLEVFKKLAVKILPKNVNYHFYGFMPNRDVINFYRTIPIDVFISTSISEGLPVSMMEAQSCGIPVIATNVGGVSEIVNNMNGCLIRKNPSIEEIVSTLADVFNNRNKWLNKRQEAIKNWQLNFNSSINYSKFVDILRRI